MSDATDLLRELDSLGTAQNRTVYPRHGVDPQRVFGVAFGELRKLQKRHRGDTPLALALWDSGKHEARLLACMIVDPAALDGSTLDAWAAELDNYILADEFAGLVARSRLARETAEAWIGTSGEWTQRTGWRVLASLAMEANDLPDEYFDGLLARLETGIHSAPNRARDGMNSALIAIGVRSPALTEAALAAAGRIGKVQVDHGQTGCVTPDAAGYIHKTLEHRQRKAAKVK